LGFSKVQNEFANRQSHQLKQKTMRVVKLQNAGRQVLHCSNGILFKTAAIGQQSPPMQSFASPLEVISIHCNITPFPFVPSGGSTNGFVLLKRHPELVSGTIYQDSPVFS
jgi:hypothetical protein